MKAKGRAKVTISAHGVRMGLAGPGSGTAKRDVVRGWTEASARSNSAFLKSVLPLPGKGVSATLTVGEDLPSHIEWARIKKRFLHWLDRQPQIISYHWLAEFQARGAPHLHLYVQTHSALFTMQMIEMHWLRMTYETGARPRGQHLAIVDNSLGWAKYLDRHGSRSVEHYQRAQVPEGWESTGRMWGKGGEWVTVSEEIYIDPDSWFRVRRIMHRLLVSRAWVAVREYEKNHQPQAAQRVRRAALRLAKRLRGPFNVSAVRGLNDWITNSADAARILFAFGAPERVRPDRPADDAPRVDLSAAVARDPRFSPGVCHE